MGTITIGLSGSGVVNGSKTYSITDPATTKFITWARATYLSTGSDAQVLAAWADAMINATKDAVTKVDVDSAVATAISGTPPVVIG